MSSGKILVVKETFSITADGAPMTVHKGKTARSTHPIVEGREHLFVPFEVDYDNDVEQATARPGEKRRGRPRKAESADKVEAAEDDSAEGSTASETEKD